MSMYSVLNTLSEYSYFYISKDITSYTFLLVFKIIDNFQCILKLCIDVHFLACLLLFQHSVSFFIRQEHEGS